jgi:hypothetical protein
VDGGTCCAGAESGALQYVSAGTCAVGRWEFVRGSLGWGHLREHWRAGRTSTGSRCSVSEIAVR